MIDYLTSLFNAQWDRCAIADAAQHDRQRRDFFDKRIFPLLNDCWHFVMYKGKPCVYEKQSLTLNFPYPTPRVVKEAEFKKEHRELHLVVSMAAFKKKAVVHSLFDIWSERAQHSHRPCANLAQHSRKPCSVPALFLFRVHHRARKEVRLAFNPTGDINELRAQAGVDAADIARGVLVVNTFVGLPVYAGLESVPLLDGLALEIDPLYWHLKHVICAGDLDATRYLCRWLAYILQHRTKTEIVPVLIGGHGTGKSMFVKKLAQMFGNHFYPMQNPQVRRAQSRAHAICARILRKIVWLTQFLRKLCVVLFRICSSVATTTSAPSSCSATSCADST